MDERLLDSAWMPPHELVSYLELGDCIEFDRMRSRMPYSHWAIYCGIKDGKRTVAHFSTENGDFGGEFELWSKLRNGSTAHVRADSYDSVAGTSHRARINNRRDRTYSAYPPSCIMRRVERKMGHTGYNLVFNNCEQFANWARYGRPESDQAGTLTTGVAVLGGLAFSGSLPVALSAGAAVASAIYVARRVLPRFVLTANP